MRRPDSTALIDELGALTFAELESRSNSLARALADAQVGEDDQVVFG